MCSLSDADVFLVILGLAAGIFFACICFWIADVLGRRAPVLPEKDTTYGWPPIERD